MKLVTGVIQPAKLAAVRAALTAADFTGLTVTAVRGHGSQKGRTEMYRGTEYEVDLLDKTRVEVLVADERLDALLDVLVAAAKSGHIGDGKVWVTDVRDVVRVRTGEKGPAAI